MKTKNKGGRPSTLTPKVEKRVELLARRGFTDKEMAQVLGTTEQTINNWKKRNPEFFDALKNWKAEADEKVEMSLYERSMGYTHKETKLFKTSDDKIISETVDRHYPPDTTACIFWLKNRRPKQWREKQEVSVSSDSSLVEALLLGRERVSKK